MLQKKGAWRLANFWCKSKRMWTRKMKSMTPYHSLRSFLFLHFRPIFCFRFFEPSCSAPALARGSKLRTSPPPLHVPCSEFTPLHEAAGRGHLETCKFLVQVKADVDAEYREYNPLPPVQEHIFLCISRFHADFLFPIFTPRVFRPRPPRDRTFP